MPARTRHAAMADHEALLDALKALTAERDEERRLRLAAESQLSASSAASARMIAERDEELSALARTLSALQAEAATTSSMLSSGLHRISTRASTSAPPAPLPTSTDGLPALAQEVIERSNNILLQLEALATRASDRDEEVHALQDKLAALQAKLDAQRPRAEQIRSASRLHSNKALPTLHELKSMLHHDNALPTMRVLTSMLRAVAEEVRILEKRLEEAEHKLRDGEKLRKKQLHKNVSEDRPPWRF